MEVTEGSPAVCQTNKKKNSKPKCARFTEQEEKALIDEVLEREEVLFGELKGVADGKSIGRKRTDTWAEIAGIISV